MSTSPRYASFIPVQPSEESFREEAAIGEPLAEDKAADDAAELAAQTQEVNELTVESAPVNIRVKTLENLISVMENHTGRLTALQANLVSLVAAKVDAPMRHDSFGYGLEAYSTARGPALINIALASFKETLQQATSAAVAS